MTHSVQITIGVATMISQTLFMLSRTAIATAIATAVVLAGSEAALASARVSHETPLPPMSALLKPISPARSRSFFAELPTDLWDRPFVYRRSAESIVFYSTGPNGIDDEGRGDDFAPKTLDEYFRARKIRLF